MASRMQHLSETIYYACARPEHRYFGFDVPNGLVTDHDGRPAYCDSPGAADAHEWIDIGGTPLYLLRRDRRIEASVRLLASRPAA